jgi:MFS family permease
MDTHRNPRHAAESLYAWTRLLVSLLLMTLGGVGMYSVAVVLPRLAAEFGAARADASLPYTLTMIGFAIGGIVMGRLSDRYGVMVSVLVGTVGLGTGYIAAGYSGSLWQFGIAQGMLIGFLGTSATFVPLVADTSRWFTKRRGFAVGICMSGNYFAGTVWPPILQHFIDTAGWRAAYIGVGVFCLITMLPLAFVLRPRPPDTDEAAGSTPAHGAQFAAARSDRPLGFAPATLQVLLCIAGVACCVAMSMPQVHIVAYCSDLGFSAARGAEMLSLMLGFGIVSRITSGWISDHIGGLRTLLLGSILQGVALLLFVPYGGLTTLYVVSALFGLFQGGIVPAYALVVREYFTPKEAGARVGTVLMATIFGMALGGWMSGVMYDLTGSYRAAFINGIAWNVLNVGIVAFLLYRAPRWRRLRSVTA